jgi:hypothetical protein
MDLSLLSQTLWTSFLATGLLTPILAALGKWSLDAQLNRVKNTLDRDLAQHKSQLDAENARSIERIRASLQIETHRAQTRTLRLIEKQAEVVTKTYALLVDAESACREMMSQVRWGNAPTPSKLAPQTRSAINRFLKYYNRHVIFMDAGTREPIDEISKLFRDAWLHYTVFGIEQNSEDGLNHERFTKQEKAWAIISEKVPVARARLEDAFRRLLGVEQQSHGGDGGSQVAG